MKWKMDLMETSIFEVMKHYGLDKNSMNIVIHTFALYTNDDYLHKPAYITIERLKLYMESCGKYGENPFIYPVYGLAMIPEGFSRKSAVYGGTFMLNQTI